MILFLEVIFTYTFFKLTGVHFLLGVNVCSINFYVLIEEISFDLSSPRCRSTGKSIKEEILAKFSQAEKMQEEWKSKVHKLEEDNAKKYGVLLRTI